MLFQHLRDNEGTKGPLIIEAEIGGHQVHRICIDRGSSFEILYEHCFNRLRPEIKNQMVTATTSLIGFSGEIKWPLRQITLWVKIGDDEHSTSAWMDFMVVRSTSPHNGTIGRPGLRKIQAVPSTTHGMIKFPVARGILTLKSSKIIPVECVMVSGLEEQSISVNKVREERVKVAINPEHPEQTVMIGSDLTEKARVKLCNLLQRSLDIFAWTPADMTGVPRHIAEHRLNVREGCQPVRQKKRGQAAERNIAINDEVSKLVAAGIMREVHYHDWLSNPVMVKKSDNSWRMCVDFKDLNKACPKDGYPLPEIDWKVESLCGFPFKCFLDAYKGYHQIQMAEEDEEKTTNLEVYVDDLVIKIRTEDEVVRDIEETFKTLRKINMKLNPKKCTFRVEEGMFLGYQVNTKGIKICPDKVDPILSLQLPKCLKDVQKLNRKLASLNRFLARSAEKSLPFFKTLKKCIKKSDFLWTEEAEAAFRQMKEHIAKLPMLTALEEQEELIVYLAASKEAVSAVLMTKREARQMPIYFVSRELRGPEVNYTAMEKLVLALVHASKRLRRYFQAHPIIVITDQPIKNILSNPEVAGRMQKWSIQLGEFGIHYRPRLSVKGQVLANFIVERPKEEGQDDSAKEEEPLPAQWTLFTNGSSCVDGCGAGVILTDPEGVKFTYALRFQFEATNNEAEYEALIAGLRIAEKIGSEVLAVVEEEGESWMTPIHEYLTDETLPAERKKASAIKRESYHTGKQLPDNHLTDGVKTSAFKHFASVTASPTNGEGRRVNRSLGEGIKARLRKDNKKWIEEISHVLWAHRTMVKSSNGDTPFSWITERTVSRRNSKAPSRTAELDMAKNDEALQINLELLEEKREQAAITEAKSKRQMEKYYNAKVRNTSFKPGDLVYRNNEASRAEDTVKLGPKWEGPYEVTEALGKGSYRLKDRNGKELSRTWNISNLKKDELASAVPEDESASAVSED
ncbi:reverse transcriptase domain-containing protein [Tanacetum coccineum]